MLPWFTRLFLLKCWIVFNWYVFNLQVSLAQMGEQVINLRVVGSISNSSGSHVNMSLSKTLNLKLFSIIVWVKEGEAFSFSPQVEKHCMNALHTNHDPTSEVRSCFLLPVDFLLFWFSLLSFSHFHDALWLVCNIFWKAISAEAACGLLFCLCAMSCQILFTKKYFPHKDSKLCILCCPCVTAGTIGPQECAHRMTCLLCTRKCLLSSFCPNCDCVDYAEIWGEKVVLAAKHTSPPRRMVKGQLRAYTHTQPYASTHTHKWLILK